MRRFDPSSVVDAAVFLHAGGVLAYPTEAVFGLGCDPHNRDALERLFALKERPPTQGVLLIAASVEQVLPYIDFSRVPDTVMDQVVDSWPGPNTWIFPRSPFVPEWVAGAHEGIALRVTSHEPAAALCWAFERPLVSTSANPHGHPPARDIATLEGYFGERLEGAFDAPLGGLARPSTIRDALSGAMIRS
ncbi:MAG: Threonylcarbamoyl-AMP synthase [Luteibacter sp.]|uniref:L-threonylcarbamoyladenylate synthase n=1 Tax=Luteibacter sp. TaxID=1886636 RepID=UPI00137F16C1|nr:Sua5/YciO/YrdC/YwlC family protein [Luteibacter sp.]KAF1007606.1 MAG: Threonylcarbamoyl-AMP synthase [Luteibacter sp.]